ncbi:MAG: hypothetical protein ACPGGM_05565, partial [Porticoccaceae bacterium]
MNPFPLIVIATCVLIQGCNGENKNAEHNSASYLSNEFQFNSKNLRHQATENTQSTGSIPWDIDGNGKVDALTDGLISVRYMFGMTDDALTFNAVDNDATRTNAQIAQKMINIYDSLDIDNNGQVDALSDGLMLLRYLFEMEGDALVDKAVAENGLRTSGADIRQYIASHMTPNNNSSENGSTANPPAEFSEAFGGASYEGETFTFPSGAEAWAGFANMNLDLYPFTFSNGGTLSFTGAVPSGGSVNVRFRFEYNPYPDVDPAYDTQTVTVSGATETNYSISIPSQGSNTFSSLIMYVVDRNAPVTISNVVVTSTGEVAGSQGTGIEPPT